MCVTVFIGVTNTLEEKRDMNYKQCRVGIEALSSSLGVRIRNKETSWLMKVFAIVLFFNKNFMTTYTTSVFSTVYFPQSLLDDDEMFCHIMPHELVHAADMKKNPHWGVLYLFPQLLALGSLFMFLAVVSSWHFLWAISLIFLLPLPSYWRKKVEMRGFAMSLATQEWSRGDGGARSIVPAYMISCFIGPDYYFMWPFPVKVLSELQDWLKCIQEGKLSEYIPIAKQIEQIFKECR